jgi:manganese/zinc/iron transport system substrate-binding protein
MSKKLLVVLLGTVLSLVLFIAAGRGKDKKPKTPEKDIADRKIEIVATTTMITDLVKNIGGERVNVTGLMGPGIDPHLYKASAGDVNRMSAADVIFYNGLHLEGKMAEIFEQMSKNVKTFAVTDGVDHSKLLTPPEFEGSHDPHVWFEVSLWIDVALYVADSLIEFDPQNRSIYTENHSSYETKLQELERYVREQAELVSPDKRVLITAHDAFNYFGKAYGFDVRGLQGISTVSEAGTGDVKELAVFIVERKIPAIFVETSVPPRYIEALQAAVRDRDFDVQIGGSLFSDALGDANTPEGTYIGMVRYNTDTIVKSLIGK